MVIKGYVYPSRPLRIAFPGAIYHVTARGNARVAIVLDGADRVQGEGEPKKISSAQRWATKKATDSPL